MSPPASPVAKSDQTPLRMLMPKEPIFLSARTGLSAKRLSPLV